MPHQTMKTMMLMSLVALLTITLGVWADGHEECEDCESKAPCHKKLLSEIADANVSLSKAVQKVEVESDGTVIETGYKMHNDELIIWTKTVVDNNLKTYLVDPIDGKVTEWTAKCCGECKDGEEKACCGTCEGGSCHCDGEHDHDHAHDAEEDDEDHRRKSIDILRKKKLHKKY